jgi:dihydroxy-acid dehydratase
MACVTESLGMSLAGCATIPAVDAGKLRIARQTGERVVQLVRDQVNPRGIITPGSIRNAIRVDMTLGGSTNTILHLMALAVEAGIPLDLDTFNAIGAEIPHICDMQPAGPHSMLTLHRAGGIPAVLSRLKGALEDAPTVTGPGIREIAGMARRGTQGAEGLPCPRRRSREGRRRGREAVEAPGACPGLRW